MTPSLPPQDPKQPVAVITTASAEETGAYSLDQLYDFFDFFDKSVGDVSAYILHCTRVPGLVSDIVLSVYFSLLQRRKFFFWKNVVQLSTILALADKAIGSMQRWEEEATGDAYIEELLRCAWDGKEQGTLERMRMLLQVLKKIPLREQKITVLQFFLRWPAGKTASILGKSKESVEREYQAVEHLLCTELEKEKIFQGLRVQDVLRSLHCPPMDEKRQTSLRLALLERCRSAQMSSLRFVLPIAASSAFLGCLLLVPMFLLQPISAQHSLKQVAAVQVLLLGEETAVRVAYIAAERDLIGIAAYAAQGDAARISLRLASSATREQLKQEAQLSTILQKLGGDAHAELLSSALLLKTKPDSIRESRL